MAAEATPNDDKVTEVPVVVQHQSLSMHSQCLKVLTAARDAYEASLGKGTRWTPDGWSVSLSPTPLMDPRGLVDGGPEVEVEERRIVIEFFDGWLVSPAIPDGDRIKIALMFIDFGGADEYVYSFEELAVQQERCLD